MKKANVFAVCFVLVLSVPILLGSALNLDKDTGDSITADDFDSIDTAVTDNDTRLDTIEALTGLVFSDADGTYTDASDISFTELDYLDGLTSAIIETNDLSATGSYQEKVLQTDSSSKLPIDMTEAVRMENMEYPERLDMTTDTSITTTQIFTYLAFTNQGASAEVDVTLPAISYDLTRIIKVEEDQVVEIGPPSGEPLYLAGTGWLTADYVVDGPATGPAFVSIVRGMNSAGAWRWHLIPALGTFSSHGGVSD